MFSEGNVEEEEEEGNVDEEEEEEEGNVEEEEEGNVEEEEEEGNVEEEEEGNVEVEEGNVEEEEEEGNVEEVEEEEGNVVEEEEEEEGNVVEEEEEEEENVEEGNVEEEEEEGNVEEEEEGNVEEEEEEGNVEEEEEGNGLLPVKWMAIEALVDRVYTHKSDVWSFGVLLWELFTLGGSPYPGLPANEVYQYLMEGNHMEKPIDCPDEMYEIMCHSWMHSNEDRPSFTDVVARLDKLLEDRTTDRENPEEEEKQRFVLQDPPKERRVFRMDSELEKARKDTLEREKSRESVGLANDDEFISEKEQLRSDDEDNDICERNPGFF
ncbi:hypothetical protein OS493_037137 [Desmophyllum pertusum]|uniref:Protein kinase domain-containing protein n=1 Tax=Desmophyllum pertusum TaxID=174260 RepID=A0A9W9ZVA4_9CNID|nr:hypothetical protein OS493_037137 [Desmophyllum pertusum]